MNQIIDVLEDAHQLLEGLDDVEQMRLQTRRQLRDLVEALDSETDRVLGQLSCAGDDSSRRGNFEVLMQSGLSALAEGNYEKAESRFERAHRARPDEPVVLNHLGLIAWERGDYRRAERRYRAAMDISLENCSADAGQDLQISDREAYGRAMEGSALSLYRLEAFEQAAELFGCLGTMFPEQYASCRYLQGEALHADGATERALEAYQRAPVEPALLYNRGMLQWEVGAHVESVRDLLSGIAENHHIARRLCRDEFAEASGRSVGTDDESGAAAERAGYLASAHYAEDYLEACRSFWTRNEAMMPRRILAKCLEDSRAQQFVRKYRAEQGDGFKRAHSERGGEVQPASNRLGTPPSSELSRSILSDLGTADRTNE